MKYTYTERVENIFKTKIVAALGLEWSCIKLLPMHRYSVDIFHILIYHEYWVLAEKLSIRSREKTPLKRVFCFLIL